MMSFMNGISLSMMYISIVQFPRDRCHCRYRHRLPLPSPPLPPPSPPPLPTPVRYSHVHVLRIPCNTHEKVPSVPCDALSLVEG